MVSVDKETGKILAEQCEQPEDIFKLSDANLLFGMLGTRSYRSFPVWGRMEKDGLVQVVIPYELSLYEKGSTLTVPDELKKINVDSNPIFIVYKLIHLRYDEKVLVYRLGCMDGGDIGYHLLLQSG